MRKVAKKPNKSSATPPKGWPSEEILKEAEKRMKGKLASKFLADEAGPVERAKYQLCAHFISYLRDEGITQRELAKRLEVTESRVSEILHYHHEQFTIDRLLELLNRIKPGVSLRVA